MTSYQSRYYLIIRPVSEEAALVEPYIESLSGITGLRPPTLRQKLTGNALQILKTDQDRGPLDDISRVLDREGIPSAVVGKDELKTRARPLQATGIEIGGDSLRLLSRNSETIGVVDRTKSCLVVLSTPEFQKLQAKRMARLSMNPDGPLPPAEILRH
ncbi:MAG: hypothetical protein V3W31_10395, partial [Thermodesulfobacteriota bacterium]